jgi:response regulator NasT
MSSVVVANSNPVYAKKIAAVLRTGGFYVGGVCESGAQLMDFANRHYLGGVVVTSVKLKDMSAVNLPRVIRRGYDFLFVIDPRFSGGEPEGCISLRMPLNRMELVATVGMFLNLAAAPVSAPRSEEDGEKGEQAIRRAKSLLMTRNHLTEAQAHRFIQKKSMDAGRKMAETAFIILNG